MDNVATPEQPQPATPPVADGQIPLTDDQVAEWKQRITASQRIVEQRIDQWKANVRAYMGRVLERFPTDHHVNIPLEFAYVELKKAQLAFQVPEVVLKPKLPGLEGAVPVFQAAVNHELDDDNAKASVMIDEVLTDTLMCSMGASKIAYVSHIRTRQQPVTQPGMPDPLTGQPGPPTVVMDPATGQPQMQDVPYLAGEEYRWDRFPLEQLLIPVEFEQSDFDRAPWLGMRFRMDLKAAIAQFGLPTDFSATKSAARETLSSAEGPSRDTTTIQQVEGTELWYRAEVFDETALPGQYRKLVLIDGHDPVVDHRDSPYQQVGDDGKLHGMEGNPIHPLTLRFLPGSAYPMGDVEIARPISEELSKGRTQMIQFRDRVIPAMGYDRTKIDPETKAKIESNQQIGKWLGFDGNPNEAVSPIAMSQFPRENFTFDEVARHDYETTWAMGRNQTGTVEPEARTATEVHAAQSAADVRLDKERTQVLRWFTKGAAKFASLLQLFKDDQGYAEIVGPDGVKALQAWDRRHIQGEFAFTAKPDSALRIDADVERRQALALYNLLGRDPNVNRVELLKTVLLRHNIDPGKIVVQTPPPAPHPEPPKISLALKGEDLDNQVVLVILQQLGIQLPPPPGTEPPQGPPGMLSQQASPPHPGATPQIEALSKHQLANDQANPKVM